VNIPEEGQAVSHVQRKMDFLFAKNGKNELGYCPAAKKVESGCGKAANQKGAVYWVHTSVEAKVRDCKMFAIQIGGA